MSFEITRPSAPPLPSPGEMPDPDEALVRGWAVHRDPAALSQIIALHHGYVFGLVLSVLGRGFEADAEDLTQEAFIRVARSLHDFRGDSRFTSWLHRLALNLALSRRRQPRWRRPHLDATVLDRMAAPVCADDPFVAAEASERARAVVECLDALPIAIRDVVQLRYWRDLPVHEIATALDIPNGTVKSRLHRGRRMLARAMESRGLGAAPRPARRAARRRSVPRRQAGRLAA